MKITSIEFVASVYRNHQVPEPRLSEIVFFGRSNVGKSTLLNKLTGKKIARISSTPGKTQCLNYYRVNDDFYLVDAPGYGYARVPEKLKLAWKRFIDEWLLKNDRLKLIVQIIDARIEPQASDLQMAEWLTHHKVPCVIVVNKIDKLTNTQRQKNLKQLRESKVYSAMEFIPASAQTGEGKQEILKVISSHL